MATDDRTARREKRRNEGHTLNEARAKNLERLIRAGYTYEDAVAEINRRISAVGVDSKTAQPIYTGIHKGFGQSQMNPSASVPGPVQPGGAPPTAGPKNVPQGRPQRPQPRPNTAPAATGQPNPRGVNEGHSPVAMPRNQLIDPRVQAGRPMPGPMYGHTPLQQTGAPAPMVAPPAVQSAFPRMRGMPMGQIDYMNSRGR